MKNGEKIIDKQCVLEKDGRKIVLSDKKSIEMFKSKNWKAADQKKDVAPQNQDGGGAEGDQ